MNGTEPTEIIELSCYVAGKEVGSEPLDVLYPYTGEVAGRVRQVDRGGLEQALASTKLVEMSRWDRHEVLNKARTLLDKRSEEFAQLIRSESGLCMRETRYEVGRAQDVLQFAAMEALRDDGQVFPAMFRRRENRARFSHCVNRCIWWPPSRLSIIHSIRWRINWHPPSQPGLRSFLNLRKKLRLRLSGLPNYSMKRGCLRRCSVPLWARWMKW